MVLFALVAVLENEKTEKAYITTQVMELERIEDADLVGDWALEYAKTQNKELRINTLESFEEMHYEIFAKKLDMPYVSFFAFTQDNYPKNLAVRALNDFEELFLKERKGKDEMGVSEDVFDTMKGLDRILTNYYEGLENIDKLNDRMNEMVNKAERNRNKTGEIKDLTSQMRFNSKRMKDRAVTASEKNTCCKVF